MNFLGKQKNTFFIGQAVSEPGTAMSNTLKDVKKSKNCLNHKSHLHVPLPSFKTKIMTFVLLCA